MTAPPAQTPTQPPTQTATQTPARTGARATDPGRPAFARRLVLVAVLLGWLVVGGLLSLALGPRTPTLRGASSGDAQLVNDVRATMTSDRGYEALSVARVRDGRVTFAGLGRASGEVPGPQTPFELGSITKTFTGLLLADAVRRGELRLDSPVSTYLTELRGTPAGNATLLELATHASGLPEFPPAIAARTVLPTLANRNPYAATSVADLLAATRTTPVTNRGHYRYSNLGMSLLGHAEARAAGAKDWATLATDRILRPLGMTSTHVATTAADVPATPATPHHDNGWPAAHWYGPAFVPAGSSTWTTAADLARYAQALLAGRAPGMAALDARAPAGSGRIGLAWHARKRSGRLITWHNGATGGYRSMLALDRTRGQAVIVLGDTSRGTEQIGLTLAATGPGQPVAAAERPEPPSTQTLVVSLAGLLFLFTFAWQASRGRDRLSVANGILSGVAGLLLLLVHGPWTVVPAWLWDSLTAASGVGAVLAVRRARRLPTRPARRPALSWLSLVVTALLVAGAVWTM